MDIDKARSAALFIARRDEMEAIVKDAEATSREKPFGRSVVTVPNHLLPLIVQIARDEMDKIDQEIARL